MILLTGYSASLVLSLHDSLVGGGSRIIGDVPLVDFVCGLALVWCHGNSVGGYCVMDTIYVDGDGIGCGQDYPERSDSFR